jgi:hypothetical protein
LLERPAECVVRRFAGPLLDLLSVDAPGIGVRRTVAAHLQPRVQASRPRQLHARDHLTQWVEAAERDLQRSRTRGARQFATVRLERRERLLEIVVALAPDAGCLSDLEPVGRDAEKLPGWLMVL